MHHVLQSVLYKLTDKKIDESIINPVRICVKKEDISFFNLSTNRIINVKINGKTFFFRECPEILKNDLFMKKAVDDFFENLSCININIESFKQAPPIVIDFVAQHVSTFREYIYNRIGDKCFILTLSQTDLISASCGFSIWKKQTYDHHFFESFGLDNLPDGTDDVAIYFLWCMRSAALSLRSTAFVYGDKYSFFCAVKAMSMQIVAEELGLSYIITPSEWCNLEVEGGKSFFGLLSNSAPGERMSDCSVPPSGALQRELINLNVLDAICFQNDHGPNNYNIYKENGEFKVCAFDNDNPSTFFPIFSVSASLAGCSPLINKKGIVNRPFFDKDLAERIRTLDIGALQKRLKPYLNQIQIISLKARIKKLQKAVKKTSEVNQSFLIEHSKWNERTVSLELKEKYGETYLTKAVNIKGEER